MGAGAGAGEFSERKKRKSCRAFVVLTSIFRLLFSSGSAAAGLAGVLSAPFGGSASANGGNAQNGAEAG